MQQQGRLVLLEVPAAAVFLSLGYFAHSFEVILQVPEDGLNVVR